MTTQGSDFQRERESLAAIAKLESERDGLLSVLQDAAECLSRLPDVDGAYRVTVLAEVHAAVATFSSREVPIPDRELALSIALDYFKVAVLANDLENTIHYRAKIMELAEMRQIPCGK